LLVSLIYLLLTGFSKWTTHPDFGSITFLIGGLIGVYFLDIADVFAALNPSPFRSIVFVTGLIIISFFIVTSSGSMLASGLVLSLFLSILLWQIGEWRLQKNLNDWYRMISGPVPAEIQQWILWGCAAFFLIETIVFIR